MDLLEKISNKRILLHLIFWAINIGFLISIFFYVESKEGIWFHVFRLIIIYIYIALSVYINLYYLIPKYLLRRRYLLFTIGQIGNVALYSFLKIYTKLVILKDPIDEDYFEEISTSVAVILSYILLVTFLKYLLQFLKERIKYNEIALKLKEIEKEKLEAELNALKGQLNPHFMFNTLNNIYSLSLDKSEKTSELILKLSDLMSYSLYECKDKYVLLHHEIEFVRNYIELEKIRIDDEITIDMNVKGMVGDMEIAPLLFMPLVENAFKHGVNKRPDNPYVYIDINMLSENIVKFSIENNFNKLFEENTLKNNGIGIKNVEKRLELLYPGNYKFKMEKGTDTFKVELEISCK